MKYRITITQIETVAKKETSYERIYDNETFQGLLQSTPPAERDNLKEYDYLSYEKNVDEVKTVYEQTLDKEINLKAIIDAVNS